MNFWGNSKKILSLGLIVVPMAILTGCLTKDEEGTDPKTTAWPAEKSLDVGGQGHASLGSALELDTGKVYLSAVANANLDAVDLVMLYYGNAWHIHNTTAAKAAGTANNINLTNSYPAADLSNNMFVKVTTKPANQEAGAKAFDEGTELAESTIVANDMFIVETTEGNLVLVTVSSVTGSTNAGAATFTISIGTI